ncbi:MAG TPA: sugar phosphate isomerase/epimerase [Planctomycetota bacterium]|nr:sugar phosphate isomerase/epimerase [Planctomycetota bacterium]
MKLGFVTAIVPELSLDEVAELASREDYDVIEIMCWPPSRAERRYAGVTHIDLVEFKASDAERVRETLAKHGIEASALGYYPNPLSPDRGESELAVAHLERVIRAAPLLGLDRVNTFVGRDFTKSIDENWPRFLEIFRSLVKLASDEGVKIGIENCPMLFTRDEWPGGKNLAVSPAIWSRMFADIPDPSFGLNYDPSHLVWQHMDPVAPLKEFRDRIHHVHAKDVRVDRERLDRVGILAHPLEYHSPKLPGLGQVDWGHFFAVLSEIGYRGPVCVEVEDRAYEDSLESRKAALRQSATYLRNFIPKRMRSPEL